MTATACAATGTTWRRWRSLPARGWYEEKTSTGKPMTRVGTLQGTYLGIYQAKVCEYWTEKPQKSNCKFCSVGLNLGIDDADEKSVDEVMEVIHAARRDSGITYVDFNTGHYEGDTYLDILEPFVRRIKAETGLLVGLQTPPHRDLKRYDALRAMGVNRVSFCFEIFDRKLFAEICPGKHREYGLDHYLEAVRYCAALGKKGPRTEPWVVNGEIIAGLEPPESTDRAPSTGSCRWERSRRSASSGPWSERTCRTCRPRAPRTWCRCSSASTRPAWRRACPSAARPAST